MKVLWLLFIGIVMVSAGCKNPTDTELISRFISNEEDFTTLVKMLNEDKNIVRLTSDDVFYESGSKKGVSLERLKIYRTLLKDLEIENGVHRDNENSIRLIVFADNCLLSLRNSEKSFLFTKDQVAPVVDSLDEIIILPGEEKKPVYRKIKDNWFLRYESW